MLLRSLHYFAFCLCFWTNSNFSFFVLGRDGRDGKPGKTESTYLKTSFSVDSEDSSVLHAQVHETPVVQFGRHVIESVFQVCNQDKISQNYLEK